LKSGNFRIFVGTRNLQWKMFVLNKYLVKEAGPIDV